MRIRKRFLSQAELWSGNVFLSSGSLWTSCVTLLEIAYFRDSKLYLLFLHVKLECCLMKWVCWSEVYIIPENLLSKDENHRGEWERR